MSQKIASLYAEIGADTSKLQKGVADSKTSLAGLAKSFLPAISAVGLLTAAFDTTVKLINQSIEAYGEAETMMVRLNATLQSTGRSAEISSEQVADLSGELSKLTGIDDEAIIAGYNALMKYESIPTDNMEEMVKISADMAAAMGGDIASNAEQLGRILETGLIPRTWGFSAALKDEIQKLIQAGDTGKAMDAIMAELNKRFGGQAVAQLDTYAGSVQALKTAWENYLEVQGQSPANIKQSFNEGIAASLNYKTKVIETKRSLEEAGLAAKDFYKEIGTGKARHLVFDLQAAEDALGGVQVSLTDVRKEFTDMPMDVFERIFGRLPEVVDDIDAAIVKTTELQDAITAMGGAEFKMDFLVDYAKQYDEVNAAIKANESEIASMRLRGIKDTDPEMQRLLRQHEELKGSMQEYLNNLLFSFAQQQVMVGGITQDEMKNVMDYGVQLGIFSQEAADAATVAWGDWLTLAQSGLNKMATDTDDVWTVTTDHIVSMLEAIPNKVTVTVQREGEGSNNNSSQSNNGGGGESQTEDRPYATGGQLRPGRWSVVGERGWELISPTGYVYSHEKSKQMTHNARPFAEGGQMADMDLSAAFDRLATRIIYGVRDAVQQVV